jgi:hypothetical protein
MIPQQTMGSGPQMQTPRPLEPAALHHLPTLPQAWRAPSSAVDVGRVGIRVRMRNGLVSHSPVAAPVARERSLHRAGHQRHNGFARAGSV